MKTHLLIIHEANTFCGINTFENTGAVSTRVISSATCEKCLKKFYQVFKPSTTHRGGLPAGDRED